MNNFLYTEPEENDLREFHEHNEKYKDVDFSYETPWKGISGIEWKDGFVKDNPTPTLDEMWSLMIHSGKENHSSHFYDLVQLQGHHFGPEVLWKEIVRLWIRDESPCYTDGKMMMWMDLFDFKEGPECLTEDLNDLEDEIRVYRGGHKEGMSWSLDRNVGEWFLKYRNIPSRKYGWRDGKVVDNWNPDDKLYSTVIKKEEVIFYENDRHEQEVVIDPFVSREYEVLEPSDRDSDELKEEFTESSKLKGLGSYSNLKREIERYEEIYRCIYVDKDREGFKKVCPEFFN